jgi:hypothetical protein
MRAMGWLGRNRIEDPVRGTARVKEMGPTATGARRTERLDVEHRFRVEVSVPGRRPYDLEHTERVPHRKSPVLGDLLPVTVSQADPSRMRIDWDAAPDLADRARAAAAAATRGDAAAAAEAFGFRPRDEPGA